MKEVTVTYKITEADSWRAKESINIKSNLADDKLIECQIAESLIQELKEKSHLLDADKLLLGFAEAQKRGIQENFEALNDLELNAKNHSDSIHQKLLTMEIDLEEKYEELAEKFQTITNKFNKNITSTAEKLAKQMEEIMCFEKTIESINSYALDNVTRNIEKILELLHKEPELIKIIFENKFNKKG